MSKVKIPVARHVWSEDNMRGAIENVMQKKIGWKLASKTFSAPAKTKLIIKKSILEDPDSPFSKEIEDEIAAHIKDRENRFLGLIADDVWLLACQPLDTAFFGSLQVYYNQQRSHPERVITHLQVVQIFRDAYLKAATLATAIKAFETTGIVPFNSDIFED
ncbi:hypothetical protein ILUMI_17122 [Ignelater luminosus]|uniref:Uncharacterized protein n=1 Tax=Ignelater luminosus TaxID=2038154 RepID=A0A8K0G7V2_IGNLU|nr:hypothetical protein ILUMI_17122 [Ignelater luminosus]